MFPLSIFHPLIPTLLLDYKSALTYCIDCNCYWIKTGFSFKKKKTKRVKTLVEDLPGGRGDGSAPANAGDMGLIPVPERVHTPQSD